MSENEVPCKHCGQPTAMTATKLCDSCWELDRRVTSNPQLARRILDSLEPQMASVLPKYFNEVVKFAAIDVLIRGIGAGREYSYTLQDVLAVASAWDAIQPAPDVEVRKRWATKTALNLNQAFRHYKEDLYGT